MPRRSLRKNAKRSTVSHLRLIACLDRYITKSMGFICHLPRVLHLTRATMEVHHFFSERFLDLGAQDLSQKLIKRRIELLPAEKSHGQGTQRESCKKENGVFPTILG